MREAPIVDRGELDRQVVALLPRRDTLCYVGCVSITNIIGVNLAIAINAASINSSASAVAGQYLAAWH